jgi:hypothetical protein
MFAEKSKNTKEFTEIAELFNGDYSDIEGIEIFNLLPNSHKIKFTEDDLDEMLEMYAEYNEVDEPNVKLSHSGQQLLLKELFQAKNIPLGEELPNLGYIHNLRKKGKSIFADIKKIPTVLKEMLFGGKFFKTISPEIVFNYKNTGKKFIKAISLTNNPSLKHISDVHMSEAPGFGGNFIYEGEPIMDPKKKQDTEVQVKDVQLSEETTTGIVDRVVAKFSDIFGKKEETLKPEQKVATTQNEQVVTMSEMEGIKKSFEAQINELKGQLITKEQETKTFSEQIKKINDDAREKKVESICKSALLEGVPSAVINHFKPVLLSELSENTIMFSEEVDGEIVTAEKPLVSVIENFFKNYPNKVDFAERTKTRQSAPSDDRYKKVQKLVKEYMAEGMSRFEALSKAGEVVGI